MTDVASQLRERVPGIETGVALGPLTTFKLGGPAEFFLKAETVLDVERAVRAVQALGIPYTPIGGGSNAVISDTGIRGLVVLVALRGVERRGDLLQVGAGENLQALTNRTAREGLSGLEFGIGIYGSVGGGVAGNAGAFGSDFASVIEEVQAVDARGELRAYPAAECGFAYRTSRFIRERAIVVGVSVRVAPGEPQRIAAKVSGFLARKKAAQPLGARCAGCIFRNPKLQLPRDAALLERFAEHVHDQEIPAGVLIQEVGLSGAKVGGIAVSAMHGNFFVNDGSGTAEQVVVLMNRAQQRVRDAFGIQLTPEVRLLGYT